MDRPYKAVDLAGTVDITLANYLKTNGYRLVMRYLDDSFGRSWKSTKANELLVLLDHDLGYLPIFETTGASGVDGTPAGKDYLTMNQGMYDAQHAMADLNTLGYPQGYPVIFSVDTDLRGSQAGGDLWSLREYGKGLRDVIGTFQSIWLYGSWDVIDFASRFCADVFTGYFQAYAPAWSDGRNANPHPKAQIVQVRNGQSMAGHEVDVDEAATEGWMQPMALSNDDKQWIIENVLQPLSIKMDSGFNTSLPVQLERAEQAEGSTTPAPVPASVPVPAQYPDPPTCPPGQHPTEDGIGGWACIPDHQ